MKKVRKYLAAMLTLALTLSAAGCSGKTEDAPQETGANTQAAATQAQTQTAETKGEGQADIGWPESNKTITIYSHSNVGSNDIYIRPLLPYLQQELGCNVVIENVTGAAGRVCSNQVWNAEKDGYTIYSMTIPLIVASDVFYEDTNDFHVTEFEPMFSFDCTPYAMIVKKGSPYETFEDVIEAAKTKEITNATSGVGGSMHLQSLVLQEAAGIQFIDIPFDGSSGAMMAVMSGDCEICILPADVPASNLEEVTVLAVFGDTVPSYYEGVPSTEELGYDMVCLNTRRTMVAPPGTPQEICDKFEEALGRAVERPEYQQWVKDSGYVLDILHKEDVRAAIQECYDAVYAMKDKVNIDE